MQKMTTSAKDNITRRLRINVAIIILLAVCLCITTFALVSSLWVRDNLFQTGKVDIEIWGQYYDEKLPIEKRDTRIIRETDFLFEPGMTVVKPAYIKNVGTGDAYCKLYFTAVEGELAKVLDVTIKDGNTGTDKDKVLYSGKVSALQKDTAVVATDAIAVGATKEYTVIFHFPEDAGNAAQGQWLSFTLTAEAVQTKNNPNREF